MSNYLQDKISGDIQVYNELIDKLNQDKTIPEDIWALLKLKVENSLLEEFGSLYPNPAENTDFMGIISTYEWIDISPILDKYSKRSVLIGNKKTFFYAEKNSTEAVNSSINDLDDPNESERKRQRLA
ncbi:hypothetical protein [Legionella sp. km772]|uniref:hypothetical protein n=1 Tax=Legionella sp. km772 TaxID=2498111 RepID=UPI000F8C3F56|nr:hypothetical protein [Legionella sp. km772]RUR08433.1 hypothetical protein ELY15_10925 [Legionella sp. km772]